MPRRPLSVNPERFLKWAPSASPEQREEYVKVALADMAEGQVALYLWAQALFSQDWLSRTALLEALRLLAADDEAAGAPVIHMLRGRRDVADLVVAHYLDSFAGPKKYPRRAGTLRSVGADGRWPLLWVLAKDAGPHLDAAWIPEHVHTLSQLWSLTDQLSANQRVAATRLASTWRGSWRQLLDTAEAVAAEPAEHD